jgi:hypothetical protein
VLVGASDLLRGAISVVPLHLWMWKYAAGLLYFRLATRVHSAVRCIFVYEGYFARGEDGGEDGCWIMLCGVCVVFVCTVWCCVRDVCVCLCCTTPLPPYLTLPYLTVPTLTQHRSMYVCMYLVCMYLVCMYLVCMYYS